MPGVDAADVLAAFLLDGDSEWPTIAAMCPDLVAALREAAGGGGYWTQPDGRMFTLPTCPKCNGTGGGAAMGWTRLCSGCAGFGVAGGQYLRPVEAL